MNSEMKMDMSSNDLTQFLTPPPEAPTTTTTLEIETTGKKTCRKCKKSFTDPQLVPHTSCCCCLLGTFFGVTLIGLLFCCCCKTPVASCPNCAHPFAPGCWWC